MTNVGEQVVTAENRRRWELLEKLPAIALKWEGVIVSDIHCMLSGERARFKRHVYTGGEIPFYTKHLEVKRDIHA